MGISTVKKIIAPVIDTPSVAGAVSTFSVIASKNGTMASARYSASTRRFFVLLPMAGRLLLFVLI